MRISDWSSDVCSSDLLRIIQARQNIIAKRVRRRGGRSGHIAQAEPRAVETTEQCHQTLPVRRVALGVAHARLVRRRHSPASSLHLSGGNECLFALNLNV